MNKKLALVIIAGIVVMSIASFIVLSTRKGQVEDTAKITPTPTPEPGFTVVRVLPSGFSPEEVNISKGMLVRFTNPLEDPIEIKWEGERQYSKGTVSLGEDIATEQFGKEGVYRFSDGKSHSGKIIVK